MTYIENIFICMASPLLIAALCMGKRQTKFFLESGLSRGDYPNYIFFECVNYPLSICSDGRQ